jgi:hypothetical protein
MPFPYTFPFYFYPGISGGASTFNVVVTGKFIDSSTFDSASCTVTNVGSAAVNISISGTDAVGDVNWTLSDNATPGVDIYGLKAYVGATPIIIKKTATFNELFHELAAESSASFIVRVYTPSSTSDNSTKIGTISLIVTAH